MKNYIFIDIEKNYRQLHKIKSKPLLIYRPVQDQILFKLSLVSLKTVKFQILL